MKFITKFLNSKKRIDGFSMIEISIMLCVMGIFLSGLLPLYSQIKKHLDHVSDQKKHERIFKILGSFLSTHRYLPCPSQKDGIASKVCSNNGVGYIPYQTLGISKKMAQDSKGWICYGVEPSVTTPFVVLREKEDALINPNTVYCRKKFFPSFTYKNQAPLTTFDPIVIFLKSGSAPLSPALDPSEYINVFTRSQFLALYGIGPCS